MTREPLDYAWWLSSRAAGGLAMVLVSASVLIGLLMASGRLRRPGLKKRLMGLHEHVALIAFVAIAVHGITLLGDRSINPGPVGVLVPGAAPYRAVYTGIGIVSGYLICGLGLSFYMRRRIGARRWRTLHRFTVLAYVLALAHSIGAGSDSAIPAVRYAVLASAVPAAVLFIIRSEQAPRRTPPRPKAAGSAPAGDPETAKAAA